MVNLELIWHHPDGKSLTWFMLSFHHLSLSFMFAAHSLRNGDGTDEANTILLSDQEIITCRIIDFLHSSTKWQNTSYIEIEHIFSGCSPGLPWQHGRYTTLGLSENSLQNLLLEVQGCTKRLFPGCVNMGWKNCALLPAAGKQNATYWSNYTQPGKSLLVQPCTFSGTNLAQDEPCQSHL